MYKLKSKVIRVINNPTGELPDGLMQDEIFIAKGNLRVDELPDGLMQDEIFIAKGNLRVEYNGKDYDIHEGEYVELSEDEVKEILFRKLDRLEEDMLGL